MFKKGIKLYSYHTFLVIPFIVVFLYAHNQTQTRPFMTYRTLWIGLLVTIVLFGGAYAVLRNRLKTGVFVTFLLFALFQYGVVYEFFEDLYYSGRWPLNNIHRYLLAVYLVVTIASLWFVKKTKYDFIKINYFLNFLLSILLLFNLAKINFGHYTNNQNENDKQAIASTPVHFDSNRDKPNFYYIILDGYASNTVLDRYYGFDNSEFTGNLKRHHFSVCDSAFSNYFYTAVSLAATLNMDYLSDSSKHTLKHLIYDNRVFKSLKANGYKIYHMYSGYAVTGAFLSADSVVQIDAPKEFEKSILKHTILRVDDLFGLFAHQRLRSQFEKMYDLANVKTTPKFCFMHFVAPHPPFIFDREGNIRTKHKFAEHSWEPKEMYIDQLIYVNKQISALLNNILASDPGAVIVLQSDHGPWLSLDSKDKVFEARSRILYAYHTPKPVPIPSNTSSVNTFRYMFNYLFNSQLDTLADMYAGKASLYNDPILDKKVH